MSIQHEVNVRFKGVADLDASPARAGLHALGQETKQATSKMAETLARMQNAPGSNVSQALAYGSIQGPAAHRARALIEERMGTSPSFLKNHREYSILLSQEQQKLRELRREHVSLRHVRDEGARARKSQLREEIEHQRDVVTSLTNIRRAGIALEERGGTTRRNWGRVWGQRYPMPFQQAISGGGFTAMAGGMGRGIMSNPILGPLALAVGGGVGGILLADALSKPSEDIEMLYENIARRTGGGNLRRALEPMIVGRPADRLRNLGFTGGQISQMVQAYGMPGMSQDLISTQAEFARRFGLGDQAHMIGGLGRRMTQLGVEPNQQTQFWQHMTSVMEQGQKRGVDSSETLKAMVGLLESVAMHTGLIHADNISGMGGILSRFAEGGRFFQGERGAQHVQQMLGAFMNPQSLQAQVLLNNAVRSAFGGIPTAAQIGLTGFEARAFEETDEIGRVQSVLNRLPQLLSGKSPARAGMRRVIESLGRGQSPQMQALLFRHFMQFETPAQAQAAMAGILEMSGGKPQGVFDGLAEVLAGGRQKELAEKISRAREVGATSSEVERGRAETKIMQETASAQISAQTLAMRTDIKESLGDTFATSIVNMSKLLSNPSEEIANGVKEGNKELREIMNSFIQMLPLGGHISGSGRTMPMQHEELG